MKKTQEGNKRKGEEEDFSQEPINLPSGATVKSSSVKEKIKAFNVGNSPNVAHVSGTRARNINVISATFNQGNLTPDASVPLDSSTPSPIASVSNTTVTGDLHVSSTVTNIQPVASVSNTQVTGDLYVKSTVKTVYQMGPDWPLAEKKFDREIPPSLKALYDSYQIRCQNSELTQALAYYVPSEATHLLGSEERFHLKTEIKQFLANKEAPPLLLIQGDSGSGKSLYANLLEQQLWQAYDPKQNESAVPIFIELKSIESSAPQDFIQHVLERRYGYTVQQIQQLRDQLQFVFILDGYDEMSVASDGRLRAIYLENELSKWRAKVIVTCRTQFLNNLSSYQHLFASTQNSTLSFKEIFITPFDDDQIEDYLKKYTKNQNTKWDAQKYLEKLDSLAGVREFIQSPLMLNIIIQVLPELEKLQSQHNPQRIVTRADIYEQFIHKWFERENLHAVVKSQDPYGLFGEFSELLAFEMFLKSVIKVEYKLSERKQRNTEEWEKFFSSKDPEIIRKRAGCPLRRIGEGLYSFYHKSFMEYFCAMHLYEEWKLDKNDNESFKKMLNTLANTDLNKKLLTHEPAIIEFLSEKIKGNKTVIERLLLIVLASKKNPSVNNAAANAITIAKVACLPRSPFSRKDFSYVQIAGADLSCGNYDRTNFSYANLSNVNFTQVWLRKANLAYCRMENMQLGELPYLEHKEEVKAISYSSDGQYLAAACGNNVELWDFKTRKRLCTFQGHIGVVTSLSFSPEGGMLVSGSEDKTVRLWDINDYKHLINFEGHTSHVLCVCFSPDGQWVASGSKDARVRLWNVKNYEYRDSLPKEEEDPGWVTSISFSPDGERLAFGRVNVVRLWWVKSRYYDNSLTHNSRIRSLCFSPDARTLAVVISDNTVRLWDLITGKEDTIQTAQSRAVISCVSFSPNGQILAWTEGNLVWLRDMDNNTHRILRGHEKLITSISFSLDNRSLASASSDGSVRLWEVGRNKPNLWRDTLDKTLSSFRIKFSGDGKTLLSTGIHGVIRLFDVESGAQRQLQLPKESITNDDMSKVKASFSSDGCTIALSLIGGSKVGLWNVKGGTYQALEKDINANFHIWGSNGIVVYDVCFSPNNQSLVIGTVSGIGILWDLKNGTHCILPGRGAVNNICFSPDSKVLAACDFNRTTIRLWSVTNNNCKSFHALEGHRDVINTILFSPDSQILASASRDNTVRLWDIKSGTHRTLLGHTAEVEHICFSPDGRILASGGKEKTVRLWDIKKDVHCVLEGHTDTITSLSFSSDSQILASSSEDKTVRLWNIKTNKCVAILEGYVDSVFNVCFYANDYLATADQGGAVRLWHMVDASTDKDWQLQWSSHFTFFCKDCHLDGVELLSSDNRALLQRGGAAPTVVPRDTALSDNNNDPERKNTTDQQIQKPLQHNATSQSNVTYWALQKIYNFFVYYIFFFFTFWITRTETTKVIEPSRDEKPKNDFASIVKKLGYSPDLVNSLKLEENNDIQQKDSLKTEKKTEDNKKLLQSTSATLIEKLDTAPQSSFVIIDDGKKPQGQLALSIRQNRKAQSLKIYRSLKNIEWLIQSLKENYSIIEIDLRACDIHDEQVRVLANWLKTNCSKLQELDLGENQIGPTGVKALLSALQCCSNIRQLNLSGNPLEAESGRLIADFLEGIEGKKFSLRGTKSGYKNTMVLGKASGKEIADRLKKGDISLKGLNLESSKLRDEGIIAIGKALEKNVSLRALNLAKNKIKDEETLLTLLKGLKKNKTLLKLELPDYQLSSSYKKDFEQLLRGNHMEESKNESKEDTAFEDKNEITEKSSFRP